MLVNLSCYVLMTISSVSLNKFNMQNIMYYVFVSFFKFVQPETNTHTYTHTQHRWFKVIFTLFVSSNDIEIRQSISPDSLPFLHYVCPLNISLMTLFYTTQNIN